MSIQEIDQLSDHEIVSRTDWLVARQDLLKREKELTRLRDQLSAERRALPWVKIDKEYVFDAPDGKVTLADLFEGRSQLFIKHFMMGPGQTTQCVGCSLEVDHIEGILVHLQNHDVSYAAVARAPIQEIEIVRKRAAHVAHRPRCFLMEWVDPPFCSGHWGPELVEIAGGHDPLGRKHQPSTRIDWQEVLDTRPEIIVLALCGYDVDLAQHDYELLREFPGFDSLPAARTGEIYLTNASAYFARPGPRVIDSIEILAGILHPKEFPEFAFRNTQDHRVAQHESAAL